MNLLLPRRRKETSYSLRKYRRLKTDEERLIYLKRQAFPKALYINRTINDQSIAYHYYFSLKNSQEKLTFLPLIRREEDLIAIATNDNCADVRYSALEKMKSQHSIRDALLSETDSEIIRKALSLLIYNTEIQVELLNRHQGNSAILEFIESTENPKLLLKTACFALDEDYRNAAFCRLNLEKMKDESKLALLRTSENEDHIYEILNTLDTGTLAEIAKGGNARIVRGIHHMAEANNISLLKERIG